MVRGPQIYDSIIEFFSYIHPEYVNKIYLSRLDFEELNKFLHSFGFSLETNKYLPVYLDGETFYTPCYIWGGRPGFTRIDYENVSHLIKHYKKVA